MAAPFCITKYPDGFKLKFMYHPMLVKCVNNIPSVKANAKKAYLLAEKIEINDIELRDLDMTVPIYLAQYGRYYAIISIKAEDTGICECKLLQLEV